MDSDTSWYEEGQGNFRNQPTTSGSQRGRPPDDELVEEKPNTKNIIDAVSLVDDEDDPEEAINSFHNVTRKEILLPFTGVEIQEELKFLEAIRQFRMILEEKVEVLTLRKNLKEMLYKYLLFFGTNYGRITVLYKDQYLDVMEDILLFYCDVIKEFFRDQKRRNKKMKVIQEARRIKILLRDCLLKKMDRILHVLLKVRLAPDIEEHGRLWGDVYMYFLTKVSYKHTDEDILRGFIAFQKFKTIRVKSEAAMIDKLMLEIYKTSTEELRRIPCLGEIMDRMKRDRLYTVRDMVTRYMRFYKEKRSRTERFEMDDFDEDTDDFSTNEMRRLDLSGSFPRIPISSNIDSPAAEIFADRRKGVRKTVLDMAAEPTPQFDLSSTEFSLFSDDNVTKRETPDDSVVVLDDEEDDDVIVVCDSLRAVITIDDDDEEPAPIPPTKSPPLREAISPDRILQPPDTRSPCYAKRLPPEPAEHTEDTNINSLVPENLSPKEPPVPKNTPPSVEKSDCLVPKQIQAFETQSSKRLVKEVDNSLKITINSLPSQSFRSFENVPATKSTNEPCIPEESHHLQSEKLSRSPTELMEIISSGQSMEGSPLVQSMETRSLTQSAVQQNTPKHASKTLNLVSDRAPLHKEVLSVEDIVIKRCTQQQSDSVMDEAFPPKTTTVLPKLDESTADDRIRHKSDLRLTEPMEVEKVAVKPSNQPNQLLTEKLPASDVGSKDRPRENEKLNSLDIGNSSNISEKLESVLNSTVNDENVPLTNASISKVRSHRVEMNFLSNGERPSGATNRVGVLPSSKIPSDLEGDTPDSSPDKDTKKRPRRHRISETSNISSPSFESIDKIEAKTYFELSDKTSSGNDTESSNASSASNGSPAAPTAAAKPRVHITAESLVDLRTAVGELELISDSEACHQDKPGTSSPGEIGYNSPENTVVPVENATESHKPCKNRAVERRQDPDSIEAKSCHPPQNAPRKPRNYSNLTECFTKFTEELSVEDILTSHPEDLASSTDNLAVATIDLVPSSDNPNDVIVVKCRPMEPLKDEEDIVSGPETVAFSTDEVLAPSDEPIALLVTYPGSSREDSRHFIMCEANIALADEQLAFPVTTSGSENTALSVDKGFDKVSVDTNSNVSHPRRETIDGLSLSGSQPYTPQSSPNTRVETVKQDMNKFNGDSNALESVLNCSGTVNLQDVVAPLQETAINKTNTLGEPEVLQKAPTTISQESKRRKSSDVSIRASKPHRRSSDLDKLAGRTDKRNCNTVENFREDLSQSVTSAKRVTPQEVDKISQLPFRYSQPVWSDRSHQMSDVSQANVSDKQLQVNNLIPAKVPQKEIAATAEKSGDQFQTSSDILSQQHLKISRPEIKQIDDLTCSASFVEEKLHELYMKEYGNNLSQPDVSQLRIQSKKKEPQESPPIRSTKMYAKDKPVKDLSQPKDRDLSLKSYKTHIKVVQKRRTSILRDAESPLQKEEGILQLPGRKDKASEDISQKKDFMKGTLSQEAYVYDHSELFNNGIEGPIGKPLGCTGVDDNFFWDSDSDIAKDDAALNGTITVKPDSQLFQATKGPPATPPKHLVSSLKSSKPKGENDSPEQKSPEKKKVTFAKIPEKGLYTENEASSAQENQPNYFDYSFNSFFASQNSLNVPLPQNLISPEISTSSYYPNLNYSGQSSVCFNNDKLQSHNSLFLPAENLEIDPNLLHSEKNVSENFNSQEIVEDTAHLLDSHYGFETSEEVPYLSLSNALIGGSIYSASQQNSIMFKDNPFIGQNVDASSASPSQPGKYLYSGPSETHSALAAKETPAAVLAPTTTKTGYGDASAYTTQETTMTSKPEPVQPSVPIYSGPDLSSHNVYYGQGNVRLPDISTLKDPRRKNNKNFARAQEMTGLNISQSNSNLGFIRNIEMVPPSASPSVAQNNNSGFSGQNPMILPSSYDGAPVENASAYRHAENSPRIVTSNQLQGEVPSNAANLVPTLPSEEYTVKNKTMPIPKVEESNPTETLQESLQKTQLPPKKRKLTEDEELAIYIQKFKEEKERKKNLEENISYPAQRQMSIADLQRDFPKVKTLAARKLYPEGTGYPDQSYYEYPQGYEQYGDFNDYGNKRSIMNVYINGVRECSANYPLCLMIGTVHTCVNNQSNNPLENSQNKPEHSDNNAAQPRPSSEAPQYAELTTPARNFQNIPKNVVSEMVPRPVVEVPQTRPKRSRKAGTCVGEAPPAKRGRGRPRKNVT